MSNTIRNNQETELIEDLVRCLNMIQNLHAELNKQDEKDKQEEKIKKLYSIMLIIILNIYMAIIFVIFWDEFKNILI